MTCPARRRLAIGVICALLASAASRTCFSQYAEQEKAEPDAQPQATTSEEVQEQEPKAPEAETGDAAAAEERMLDGMQKQFAEQLRPMFRAELYLIYKICRPSEEQLNKLRDANERALTQVAQEMAKVQDRMNRGNFRWVAGQTSAFPDPRGLLEQTSLEAMKDVLSESQLAAYENELTQRQRYRQTATIRTIIAKLAKDLTLSPEQCQQIAKSLEEHWDVKWVAAIEMYATNDEQFFPSLPDKCISPYLTPSQKKVWTSRQNRGSVFWGGFLPNMSFHLPFDWDKEMVPKKQ